MNRVRIALLLLALGIALPSWLIVSRALSGLAFEKQVRHEAVAARIFDEMERTLSEVLAREEARPFEAYPVTESQASAETDGAPFPFVLAYFQMDPDGTLLSRGSQPAADAENPVAPLEASLRGLLAAPRSRPAAPPNQPLRQTAHEADEDDAGEAEELARVQTKREAKKPAESVPERVSKRESATAYDVIENLNIAAEQRASRKQKVVVRPRSELYAAADEAAQEEPLFERRSSERSRIAGRRYDDAADLAASLSDASAAATPPSPGRANAPSVARPSRAIRPQTLGAAGPTDSLAAASPTPTTSPSTSGSDSVSPALSPTVRLAIDPMVGRVLQAEPATLVLSRTVLVGKQGYRQGLLVDLAALGRWLDAQVLAERGLAEVAGAAFTATPPNEPLEAAGSLRFSHHFGEPFDALYVALDLEPLPGLGGTTPLYALSAMLIAVTLLGLAAVYRMVSVVVSFAQRRSNFVAAVSHELKTPLTSIRMYGEMLRDGVAKDESKRAEYLETITDEAERLTRLINNVLEFSRLENNQRSVAMVAGQLGPVLVEVAEKLRPHATREGFSLSLVVPDDLAPVRFDRDALLQILFNLVDNAMKYAASAERKEIVLEAHASEGGVSVRVRDFGPGVPRKHLAHIFEPFYRGEDELVRGTKGTGIGLALVRDMVVSMGARVDGSNAEGGGFQVDIAFDATR